MNRQLRPKHRLYSIMIIGLIWVHPKLFAGSGKAEESKRVELVLAK